MALKERQPKKIRKFHAVLPEYKQPAKEQDLDALRRRAQSELSEQIHKSFRPKRRRPALILGADMEPQPPLITT